MAAPYLVSRTFDPLFAFSIGLTSFWVRARREEIERWHLWHYVDPTSSSSSSNPTSSSTPSNTTSSFTPSYLQPSTTCNTPSSTTPPDPLRPSQTSASPSPTRDPSLSQPPQPGQLRTAPRPSRLNYYPQSHKTSTAVEQYLQKLDHEPTMGDTWQTLVKRVRSVDVRGFEWGSLWRGRESWGVVD